MTEMNLQNLSGKILVIDDEPINRNIIVAMLEKLGLEAYEAANGMEGLALISEHDYNLVILDLIMPEMDGLEVYQKILGLAKQPKVLMMSGVGLNVELMEIVDNQRTFFTQKPIKLKKMSSLLSQILELKYC